MTLLLILLVLVVIGLIPALSRSGKEGHRFGTVLNGPDGRSLRNRGDSGFSRAKGARLSGLVSSSDR